MSEAGKENEPVGLAQLRKIVDTMVPPTQVVVRDIVGNEYRLPGAVSARVQIEILRIVEDVAQLPLAALVGGEKAAATAGGALQMISAMTRQPRILAALSEAFSLAHPKAVGAAKEAAENAGYTASDAADVFPAEELVAGLVPLFVRLVKRASSAAQAVGVHLAEPNRAAPQK